MRISAVHDITEEDHLRSPQPTRLVNRASQQRQGITEYAPIGLRPGQAGVNVGQNEDAI
jgi:hypothetical protein